METVFNKSIKTIMVILIISLLLSITPSSYAASSKVKSVTLNKTEANINVGDGFTLKATVKTKSILTSKKVIWSSSNSSVATVTSKGKVSGKSAGTAIITATSKKDSSKKASCTVKVTNKTATLQYKASVYEDETIQLSNKMATPKVTSWKSENDKIAKVVLNGEKCTVRGIKAGKVKINGYGSVNNIPVVTYELEVKLVVKVKSLKLDKSSHSIAEGNSFKLNVTFNPVNPTFKTVTWSSSNSKVATVDSNGNVKGIKEGTANITVTKDGKTVTCKVTVTEKWFWPVGPNSQGKPYSTNITSNYGYRELKGSAGNFHTGIDIKCSKGTPVIASRRGKVIAVVTRWGDGGESLKYINEVNYVHIQHSDGSISKYLHLSSANVKVGDTVSRGQVIAKSGNSGHTTGPHLHFEVLVNGKTVDPEPLLNKYNPY